MVIVGLYRSWGVLPIYRSVFICITGLTSLSACVFLPYDNFKFPVQPPALFMPSSISSSILSSMLDPFDTIVASHPLGNTSGTLSSELHLTFSGPSTLTSAPKTTSTPLPTSIMPSAALQQKASTMQDEAALLDAHARVLSNSAQELSSFASIIAFLSNGYLDQSDMLGDAANRIMAGGPEMEFLVNCDTNPEVVVARVTRQAALAAVTNDARDFVRKTLHSLTIMLADTRPEVKVEVSGFLKKKRLLLEKGQCKPDNNCHPIAEGGGECDHAMHTLKRQRHGTDNCTYSSSQFDLVCNTSKECNEIPALDPGWRSFSDSWKAWNDEDESNEMPVAKSNETLGATSDETPVDKSSSNSFESGDSHIYLPNPSSEEEELTPPEQMERERDDPFWKFVRNPYELATRTAWMGESSVPRSFILEAAERAANPNLASGALVNCAAALV